MALARERETSTLIQYSALGHVYDAAVVCFMSQFVVAFGKIIEIIKVIQ